MSYSSFQFFVKIQSHEWKYEHFLQEPQLLPVYAHLYLICCFHSYGNNSFANKIVVFGSIRNRVLDILNVYNYILFFSPLLSDLLLCIPEELVLYSENSSSHFSLKMMKMNPEQYVIQKNFLQTSS
jgi:hypothetical protein